MSERCIIHLDLDAFFASVEELRDPSIVGQPIIVGGDPRERGVVASASYAARTFGVHSAMPMAQALRLCPHAVVRHGHYSDYSSYSRRVMAILGEYTPLMEQISIDEAFLDVTGSGALFGPPENLARTIQQRIKDEVGLPSSLGVAGNKLVAKIASARAKPCGVLVVPCGQEASFLAPLPIERLWGVGKVTSQLLRSNGVSTIGDLARLPLPALQRLFGHGAESMRRRAVGIDDRLVSPESRHKSVSQERTFARDVGSLDELLRCLLKMSDEVSSQLRREGEYARVVVLKMRYPDFTTITRRITLDQPTDLAEVLYDQAGRLLRRELGPGVKLRLIGVGAAGLTRGTQLTLFETQTEQLSRLSQAVDDIRRRYGNDSIRRASFLEGAEDPPQPAPRKSGH